MTVQNVSTPADVWLKCKGCGADFLWSARDQTLYAARRITPPRSCRPCRELRKQEAEVKNERIEAEVSSNRKQSGVIRAYFATKGFGFIEISEGHRQVFFHVSALRCKPNEISVGAAVEFYEIESVRKKNSTCAERVTLAEAATPENGAQL